MMSRGLGRGLALIVIEAIFLAGVASPGAPGPKAAAGFTLTVPRSAPSVVPFALAPPFPGRSLSGRSLALGFIEDPDAPYNTAIGGHALANNVSGERNTVSGYNAMFNNSTGTGMTASGYGALYNNLSGTGSVAIGCEALFNNTTGSGNIAVGYGTLFNNIIGGGNVAVGNFALYTNTESHDNTAIGYNSLYTNDYGFDNTAVGHSSLLSNTNGHWNTAVGRSAGEACTGGQWNIYLGAWATGTAEDTNTIRIGTAYEPGEEWPYPKGQNQTFVAGIVEKPLTDSDVPAVVGITPQGQLGTMPADLLPPGPQGPRGVQGPAGEGLVSGSLLFLQAGTPVPDGYQLLGTTEFLIAQASKKNIKIVINVYQKL